MTVWEVFAAAFYGISDDMFNPLRELPGWCWFSDNPPLCSETEEVECLRGENSSRFNSDVTWNVLGAWILIILCMILIVLKVRQVESKLKDYAVGNAGPGNQRGNEPTYARTRATARQALLYIGAFFVVFSAPVILFGLPQYHHVTTKERATRFFLAMLTKVFTPMQVC